MDIIKGKEIPATFLVTSVDEFWKQVWGNFKIKGKEVYGEASLDLNTLEELIDPVKKRNKL